MDAIKSKHIAQILAGLHLITNHWLDILWHNQLNNRPPFHSPHDFSTMQQAEQIQALSLGPTRCQCVAAEANDIASSELLKRKILHTTQSTQLQ